MELTELSGLNLGPYPFRVSQDLVHEFVAVTGDDEERWVSEAPPGLAAAALFVVAPELLGMMTDRSVVHGEQTFVWDRPIPTGAQLQVSGVVTRVRERAGVHYVGFDINAGDATGEVLRGSSLFLTTGSALPVSSEFERPEPPHSHRGDPGDDQVAASRADLIHYAAATRDWNPIHWDHDAAVAAGLPGVVVHGLLQSSWALAAVTRRTDVRVGSARMRFRSPLLPARPADVDVEPAEDGTWSVSIHGEDDEYLSARIVTTDE